jgi:hypothetical protein
MLSFENLEKITYEGYLNKFPFYLGLGISLEDYSKKPTKDNWSSVDPKNKVPFPAELDDLIRLHYLVVSRKVTTILEFGVGKSTFVFDQALSHNKTKHAS